MPLLTPTYLEANQKGHYSLSSGVSVMTGKDVTSRQPLFEATVPPVSERTNDSGHFHQPLSGGAFPTRNL